MKIVVDEKNCKGEIKYPCLMKAENGNIVLFSCYGEGMCIRSDNARFYDVGDYAEDWDMDCFKPFNGTIILSND